MFAIALNWHFCLLCWGKPQMIDRTAEAIAASRQSNRQHGILRPSDQPLDHTLLKKSSTVFFCLLTACLTNRLIG